MIKPWFVAAGVTALLCLSPGALLWAQAVDDAVVNDAVEAWPDEVPAESATADAVPEAEQLAADSPAVPPDPAPTLGQWLCHDGAMATAPLTPRPFAPGAASTAAIDEAIAFHPNGHQAWVSRREGVWGGALEAAAIHELERRGESWVEVGLLDLAAVGSAGDPFIAPDGQRLFFIGPNRRLVQEDSATATVDAAANTDLWVMHWDGHGWVAPRRLGWEVNSSADEYRGSVTRDGTLYFASARGGGAGQGDVYVAPARAGGLSHRHEWDDDHAPTVEATEGPGDEPQPEIRFAPAQLLPSALNSGDGEWNVSVAPDGSLALFEASGRDDNVSAAGDVYVSWRRGDDWTEAVNVRVLNSPGSDLNVSFGPARRVAARAAGGGRGFRSWAGPRHLYYASTRNADGRHTDIYQAPVTVLQRYCPNVRRQLVVVNRAGHSVDVIDLHNGERERITIGKGPHLAALNPVNHRLFVANYGRFPEPHDDALNDRPPWQSVPGNTVSVLLLNQSADRLRDIPVCQRPHGIATERDRLWVSCEEDGVVQAINPNIDTVLRSYTVEPGVHVLLKYPGQPLLLASNPERGTVSRIDLSSGEVRSLETGAGAEAMAWVDDVLWVANSRADTLSIVDVENWFVVETLNTPGQFPIALAPTPDGREVWMAQLNGRSIAVFDAEKRLYKATIPLKHQPLNLTFDPVTQNAFVTLPRRNTVIELDRFTHDVVATYAVGSEPDGVMVRLHAVP